MAVRQPQHKRLADLLRQDRITHKSGELRYLIGKASQNRSLADSVNGCIPRAFQDKVSVIDLKNKILTLSCPSAALATQFRFQLDATLSALQNRFCAHEIQQIKLKIRPARRQQKSNATGRNISKKNAQLLEEVAGQTNDHELRQALERLANRAS